MAFKHSSLVLAFSTSSMAVSAIRRAKILSNSNLTFLMSAMRVSSSSWNPLIKTGVLREKSCGVMFLCHYTERRNTAKYIFAPQAQNMKHPMNSVEVQLHFVLCQFCFPWQNICHFCGTLRDAGADSFGHWFDLLVLVILGAVVVVVLDRGTRSKWDCLQLVQLRHQARPRLCL